MGQPEEVEVTIVTVRHTFDDYVQNRAAEKMVPQLTGQGNVIPLSGQVEAARAKNLPGADPRWTLIRNSLKSSTKMRTSYTCKSLGSLSPIVVKVEQRKMTCI